jgi:hypothetical protein
MEDDTAGKNTAAGAIAEIKSGCTGEAFHDARGDD